MYSGWDGSSVESRRNPTITRAYAAATHGLSTAWCGISANASLARAS
jgi:hypothetical protein